VNSSRPATNSLVPSSGSIRQRSCPDKAPSPKPTRSSDRVGSSGTSRARPSGNDPVGGEVGFGYRRSIEGLAVQPASPPVLTARMAAPARTTRSVRGLHQGEGGVAADCGCRRTCFHSWRFHVPLVFPLPRRACVGSPPRPQCIKPASMRDSPWSALSADLQEHLMSGTSSPGPAPDALELAALLCSRVFCHDSSVRWRDRNGLRSSTTIPSRKIREFALDLIRKSARTASARLQFCRLAFGAAGSSGAQSIWAMRRPWRGAISRTARDHDRVESAARAAAEEPGQSCS